MSIDLQKIARQEKKRGQNRKKTGTNNISFNLSFDRKVTDKKKYWFYNELSLLLSSGVDLKTSFELISSEEKGHSLTLLNSIKDDIIEGQSLSESLAQNKSFGAYDRYTIKIGEESGKLARVLQLLADYYDKKLRLRRQIISALTYPTLVIITAIGAISFLLNYLVPMFEDIFQRFSGELPAITQRIIDLSKWLSENGLALVLIAIGLIIGVRLIKNHWFVRKTGTFLALNTPVFGVILLKNNLARFCQAMGLLLGSNVPLSHALELTSKMVRFYPLEKALPKIQANIEHGQSLHQCLQAYGIFDRRMVYLVKVAEEINRLDEIFERLQQQYFDDVEHRIKVLNNLLEPFLIIIVGLIVGLILVAMYLPLFQLSGGFM